ERGGRRHSEPRRAGDRDRGQREHEQPGDDRRRRRRGPGAALRGEGDCEEDEAGDRDADGPQLATRRALHARREPLEEREQPEPARGDRLDERERRQLQRRNVQRPAGEPDEEAGKPRPAPGQQPQGGERTADGEGRHGAGRTVLCEEAPVERRRRGEGEEETGRGGGAHFLSVWNGRYASAASAAIPTRGRSSLRS